MDGICHAKPLHEDVEVVRMLADSQGDPVVDREKTNVTTSILYIS